MDGLGVGSFEYGWLRENVLSASLVLGSGDLVEVAGQEVPSFVGPGAEGIVVGAKLRTRRADADVPFGVAFGSAALRPSLAKGGLQAPRIMYGSRSTPSFSSSLALTSISQSTP